LDALKPFNEFILPAQKYTSAHTSAPLMADYELLGE
jgi:hypothetical protein